MQTKYYMKTVYLYVRVSTDEQKRKGYSLVEQEDRLRRYCEQNDIQVKGIYREDFSAKNFNRPEWKNLINVLRRSPATEPRSVLFIKWDRFSRNIEYAYEMIGILRKYNVIPAAIDQPIDLDIPESSVMLAVYLAIPESENLRRSLNTSNGMRKAKQLGRFPNKAPIGYINSKGQDGKRCIVPHYPEAELILWSFEQLAKNAYRVEDVRRMANARGLNCSRSYFWKLLHNPVYYGYIPLETKASQESQLIKGIHDPIVSEALFYQVQDVINTRRKVIGKSYELNELLLLRRYLDCPACARKLTGSISTGSTKKHPYYHCRNGCKTRFRAEEINDDYEFQLRRLILLPGAEQLFKLILEDINISVHHAEHLNEQRSLRKQIKQQESYISKTRRLFIEGKIQFDDFINLKKDYKTISNDMEDELEKVDIKLTRLNEKLRRAIKPFHNIFRSFGQMDVHHKKHLIDLVTPIAIDADGRLTLKPHEAITKILSPIKH